MQPSNLPLLPWISTHKSAFAKAVKPKYLRLYLRMPLRHFGDIWSFIFTFGGSKNYFRRRNPSFFCQACTHCGFVHIIRMQQYYPFYSFADKACFRIHYTPCFSLQPPFRCLRHTIDSSTLPRWNRAQPPSHEQLYYAENWQTGRMVEESKKNWYHEGIVVFCILDRYFGWLRHRYKRV